MQMTEETFQPSETMVNVETQQETDRLINLKFTVQKLQKDQNWLLESIKSLNNKSLELSVSIENMENHKKELTDEMNALLENIQKKKDELSNMELTIKEELNLRVKEVEQKELVAENQKKEALNLIEIASWKMAEVENKNKELEIREKNLITILKQNEDDANFNESYAQALKSDKAKLAVQIEKYNTKNWELEKWEKSLKERENTNNSILAAILKKEENVEIQRTSLNQYEQAIIKDKEMIEKKRIVLWELQSWLISTVWNKEVTDAILTELNNKFKTLL